MVLFKKIKKERRNKKMSSHKKEEGIINLFSKMNEDMIKIIDLLFLGVNIGYFNDCLDRETKIELIKAKTKLMGVIK